MAKTYGKSTLGSFIVQSGNPCPSCDGSGSLWIFYMSSPNTVTKQCPDCKGSKRMTFNIGTGVGLTEFLRKKIYDNQSDYLGRLIVYKCKQHGMKIKPRHPVMVGFRSEIDL